MRHTGMGLLLFALVFTVASAGDNPADDPEPLPALKKKDKAKAPDQPVDDEPLSLKKKEKPKNNPEPLPKNREKLPGDDQPAPRLQDNAETDQAKEILARVAKNMEASEDRLKKRDPGDKTRQIQQDIIKDLDELIKQQQDNNSSSSSSSSSSSQESKGGKSSQSAQKSQRSKGSQKTAQNSKNQGGQDKDKKDSSAGADKNQGQGKGKEGDASASKSGNGGGGKDSAGKKNTVADLFRDVWGHLPEAKRLEMDAYSRERFMPKYDDLLRQYYRSISEQNRRIEGE